MTAGVGGDNGNNGRVSKGVSHVSRRFIIDERTTARCL